MVSRISSREAKDDVQRHKRHKSMNRSKPLDDESVLIFPISDPKYDFEYPLPKFGKESRFNLLFDYQNNSWFRWPLKNQMKPMAGDYLPVHRLLFTPERDFLINNSGHKVGVSELLGKEVFVLVSWSSWHEEGKQLLKRLKRLVTRVRKPKRLVIRKRSEVSVRRISLEGCRTDEGFMEGDDFPIIHISAEGVSHKDYTGKDRVLLCPSRKAYYSCKSSCIGLHSEPDVLVFGRDGRVALTSWREDVGGGRVEEFFTHICDISPELLLSVLRIRYSYKNLVCWLDLSGDRKLTDIEYI